MKLDTDGSSLVLESNGTPVEDTVLPYVKNQTLILLQKDEKWIPDDIQTLSIASTVTVTDTSESLCSSVNQKELDISHNVNCNSEFRWSTLEVPWDKLSNEQMEELNNGIKSRQTVTALLHLTINEMRSVKHIIPTKAFKLMAKKIIDRFPDIFRDVDEEGVVLGDGTHSLVSKLQDRNNYLNRPHKRRGPESSTLDPILTKKRSVSARAGCVNWSANHEFKQKENITTLTEGTDENFYAVLEETYSEIRLFINDSPSLQQIKEKWPIFFSKRAIFWHFNTLTNSDINLINTHNNKLMEKLDNFLNDKVQQDKENDNHQIGLKNIIKKVCLFFKEDCSTIYFRYQVRKIYNIM